MQDSIYLSMKAQYYLTIIIIRLYDHIITLCIDNHYEDFLKTNTLRKFSVKSKNLCS